MGPEKAFSPPLHVFFMNGRLLSSCLQPASTTMATDTPSSRPRGDEPLDAALRPIHAGWLEDAHRLLEPALEPDADFWARWAAVRYIADDFREQYRLERSFVNELRPFLQPDIAEQLVRQGERVFQLRLELDRIGRRRGTAEAFAGAARYLLEQLGLWCTEIQLATRDLTRDILPPEGEQILGHLEAALAMRP